MSFQGYNLKPLCGKNLKDVLTERRRRIITRKLKINTAVYKFTIVKIHIQKTSREKNQCKLCKSDKPGVHKNWQFSALINDETSYFEKSIKIPQLCVPAGLEESYYQQGSWKVRQDPPSLRSLTCAFILTHCDKLPKTIDLNHLRFLMQFNPTTKIIEMNNAPTLDFGIVEHPMTVKDVWKDNFWGAGIHYFPYYPPTLYHGPHSQASSTANKSF
ncbi:hypothetical protein KQX54_018328 [Cotesia glomerata]|uniref:Uncharacterized protein n=1 Tax=Cotesia glomerata TaxID=32391 RepID=A0AAV7IR60_COTGL|nr:hypothetical protein KQX54_018328 [Cotesia glomerata]